MKNDKILSINNKKLLINGKDLSKNMKGVFLKSCNFPTLGRVF
jgi:hypothetical protein